MPNSTRHRPPPWLRAFWQRACAGERHRALGHGRLQPDARRLPLRPARPPLRLRPGAEDRGGQDQRPHRPPAPLPQRRAAHADRRPRSDPGKLDHVGIAAFFGSLWIGASFWGAMDTAFGRIYHVDAAAGSSRSASPSQCSASSCCSSRPASWSRRSRAPVVSSTDRLPLGLSHIRAIDTTAVRRRPAHHLPDLLRDLLGRAEGPHALALRSGPGRPSSPSPPGSPTGCSRSTSPTSPASRASAQASASS